MHPKKRAQKDEYTAEQRLEFIQDAIELEKQMAEEKFRLAKEEPICIACLIRLYIVLYLFALRII